jgi:DTW domain-containing protein YfiP
MPPASRRGGDAARPTRTRAEAIDAAVVPPGRCPRCAFPTEGGCLCPEIPRLEVPYRFVILRHASEIPRLTNSGRWAALALEGAVIHDHARGEPPTDGAVEALIGPAPAVLLYPSPHAPAVPSPRPVTVVVPDATWPQARRMVQRLAPLRTMPRLPLPVAPPPALRLRRPPVEGGLSTLEAIAGALHLLGEPAAAARLGALHEAALEKTLRLKGMWPPGRDHHRRIAP